MSYFLNKLAEVQHNNLQTGTTENGAEGYLSAGKALLDMNYKVPYYRTADEAEIIYDFIQALDENVVLAVKWLFFARDARGGLGERRLFRVLFSWLIDNAVTEQQKANLIALVAEYGRYDDLVYMLNSYSKEAVLEEIIKVLSKDIETATENMVNRLRSDFEQKPISLLAKWLPSENASSKETRKLAKIIIEALRISPRAYRLTLTGLRKDIGVVESKISANKWGEVDYSTVPSLANLKYKNAFVRHDQQRREEYLEKVASGELKINSSVCFPHEIVRKYKGHFSVDETLEEMWKALPDYALENTLTVADGSGSMMTPVGGGLTSALDVANALAIYTAERCKGEFKNHYITFSSHPQLVDLGENTTLRAKLNIAYEHDECSNTNIQKVFELILNTAVKNHMSQDDIPKNILIISDMEFDEAQGYGINKLDRTLFETIARKYEANGYKLPRLVFWNVNSRTNVIPVVENELGVVLVSGFSTNILKLVLSNKTDAYEVLVDTLNSERYDAVGTALGLEKSV